MAAIVPKWVLVIGIGVISFTSKLQSYSSLNNRDMNIKKIKDGCLEQTSQTNCTQFGVKIGPSNRFGGN